MATSVFDQKAYRPTNQMYFFQLVPNLLTVSSPSFAKNLKSTNSQFRLKIMKGVQLCDEMKKSIAVKAINGKAAFDKVSLNFNLPSYNPNRSIEFILILLKSEDGQQQQQVGRHVIISSAYIVQFKDSNVKNYHDNVNLSDNYSLSFDLYIDNSRFGLEKFVKQIREEKKQQKRQNVVDVTKKDVKQNLNTNQARSEVLSSSDKVEVVSGEGRFMSPTRRIVRKQSQTRKLLKKQSSPEKSQQQGQMKKGLRFLSRNSQRQTYSVQKSESLAEEQAKKLSSKIKQQEQKREKLIKQRQRADTERKNTQQKRKKQQQIATKAEQARKAAEERKIQAQRKRQQQQAARKAEQTRKAAEQKRLQAQKKRQEQEEARRKAAQDRKLQQQAKRQEQQAQRKAQESRQAAQARRLQAQKKRQQEKNRRLQQQRVENQRKQMQRKRLLQQQQIREQNEKIQKTRQKNQTIKRQVRQPQKLTQPENTKLFRKQQQQQPAQLPKLNEIKSSYQKNSSFEVNVKGENAKKVTKYIFEAHVPSPLVASKEKPQIRATNSMMLDQNGKPLGKAGWKIKAIIVAVILISLFFIGSMIGGGEKESGKQKRSKTKGAVKKNKK